MHYPSIFNDVLGPVMRGPSSSHCAASLRIGRLCRDLMGAVIDEALIAFDPHGSLATTHESQGSDMGLFGGFLGWEAHDERLQHYREGIKEAGIGVEIEITPLHYEHPNTYRITLRNREETRQLTAVSTGGGMIEVVEIDGAEVSIPGDYCETLVYTRSPGEVRRYLEGAVTYDELIWAVGKETFLEIKSREFPPDHVLEALTAMEEVACVKKLNPVLPVKSRKNLEVPFITCKEMLAYNDGKDLALWELAVDYEAARGKLTHDEVVSKMTEIVGIMSASVTEGLKGTEYPDRILPCQSVGFKEKMEQKELIDGDVLNKIIMFVTAIMEVKSAMGVIVAAPTAGSCGALPGAILGAASAMGLSEGEVVKAMLAAGMIGVFISAHASFAAEVGGCQAECGSGAGMAAAALVGMAGGDLSQSLSAASIALQNSFGMICDPIANRVEAPCLGKNVSAASNALSCANMALADYNHLIPLDEVIEAMDKVGKSIHNDLRCTALGGLSVTPTSKEIEARLQEQGVAPAFRFKIC
ncbi:MAG: L-serine ammonia-lyase, iron-sulfur-dependent, subunit alpha [Acidobacteriota bacterium]|nr:L-serine ammonia-lyase, iron-sulfur-dependent, subunit alpha [Acidobacteriota bacterium]